MSDKFKNQRSQCNSSHSYNPLTQEQSPKEQFYEISSFGNLKDFKKSYDFVLPFTLFQKAIQDDSEGYQPEPFNFTRIKSFQDFSFDYLRGSDKFEFEQHIYIFYNVGEQKKQLQAAIKLYQRGRKLHRSLLIWVKCSKRGNWKYFDIKEWKNMPLLRPYEQEEYFNIKELEQELKQYLGQK